MRLEKIICFHFEWANLLTDEYINLRDMDFVVFHPLIETIIKKIPKLPKGETTWHPKCIIEQELKKLRNLDLLSVGLEQHASCQFVVHGVSFVHGPWSMESLSSCHPPTTLNM